jgi:hypothetical protein
MKHLREYIVENTEIIYEEDLLGLSGQSDSKEETSKDDKKDDSSDDKKDDSTADDLLGGEDGGDEDKKDDENKDDESAEEDPNDDKGSEPEIDPKLKERAEIKFKIWKDGGERADWINDNDGYQKIEYIYKDKEKGITIDFLLGRKDGEWCLWAGKDGGVNYDDEPMYKLDAHTFQKGIMNSLDKIQDLIQDVKDNPDNWVQFYINK